MTDNERMLVELINTISEGAMRADDKIITAIENIAKTTKAVILELNNKVVDLDERLARLENKINGRSTN